MKKVIKEKYLSIAKWFSLIVKKETDEVVPQSKFHSLAPISDADKDGEYSKMLNWALQNRGKDPHDIKNIALTGSYGSGKSSILKTFQKNNKDKSLAFLPISLATFKEEQNEEKERNEILRLIELSILQQIFYHEKDSSIPDTRFRKIQSFSKVRNWIVSIVLFAALCSVFIQIYPTLLEGLLIIEFSQLTKNWIHYSTAAIALLGTFYFIFKTIRPLRNIQLKKFNLQGEIELGENISKSILNDYLDEILYFFEVTEYNVVIIEDLDRFEQTEIFTKLREINLLINNSKKIKRDIVFIYAVRDDMFQDKDRTKFFDFIIPVIPVINSSNSNEKLLDIVNANSYRVSQSLIDDISLFIDDMRLLYNVTNEFHLYRQKFDRKLSANKLLAMILYKNIYPNDFVALSNNEGDLYNVFNSKTKFIKEKEKGIEEKISKLKQEIDEIESIQITDIKELRMIYILSYIDKLNEFSNFFIGGMSKSNSEMTESSNFKHLENDTVEYQFLNHRGGDNYVKYKKTTQVLFEKIQDEVDPNYTYKERAELIDSHNKNKVEEIKTKILSLEKEKHTLRHIKIKNILEKNSNVLAIEDSPKKQLIKLLLLNGYIDENYLDYISIFYEGSITKSDRDFLLNIKSQAQTEYDYSLQKIENLLPKIGQSEFERPYVLNYNLLDYLFTKKPRGSELTSLFSMISSELGSYFSFIDGFVSTGKQVSALIKRIIKVNPRFWHYIVNESNLPNKRILEYYKLILEYGEIEDIKVLSKQPDLVSRIEYDSNFLDVIRKPEKIKNIIQELDIRFNDINPSIENKELFDFVYEGNHYDIKEKMLSKVMTLKGAFSEEEFQSKNYYAISNSNCDNMINYINGNIEYYVENVYLKLENNTQEEESLLASLLNNEDLSYDNKLEIIQKVETKILNLEDIDDLNISQNLLEQSRVEATWENLIHYYSLMEKAFDEYLIGFLNEEENVKQLSKTKIDNMSSDTEEVADEFIKSLVTENEIEDIYYEYLLNSVPFRYKQLDFHHLEPSKAYMLINNGVLTFTQDNYEHLVKNFVGLHIKLIEKYPTEFIKNISSCNIDDSDVLKILDSENISTSQKNKIVNSIDEDLITSRSLKTLGELLIKHNSFSVSKSLLKNVLTNRLLLSSERVKILVKDGVIQSLFNETEITDILNAFPEPFKNIARKGKRPKLTLNEDNIKLAQLLKDIQYIKNFKQERKGVRISTFLR